MPLQRSFDQKQKAHSNKEIIKQYGPNEGILISDFDHFMPRNNPIVDFTPEMPTPIAEV